MERSWCQFASLQSHLENFLSSFPLHQHVEVTPLGVAQFPKLKGEAAEGVCDFCRKEHSRGYVSAKTETPNLEGVGQPVFPANPSNVQQTLATMLEMFHRHR